jgi:hypothetical protein
MKSSDCLNARQSDEHMVNIRDSAFYLPNLLSDLGIHPRSSGLSGLLGPIIYSYSFKAAECRRTGIRPAGSVVPGFETLNTLCTVALHKMKTLGP